MTRTVRVPRRTSFVRLLTPPSERTNESRYNSMGICSCSRFVRSFVRAMPLAQLPHTMTLALCSCHSGRKKERLYPRTWLEGESRDAWYLSRDLIHGHMPRSASKRPSRHAVELCHLSEPLGAPPCGSPKACLARRHSRPATTMAMFATLDSVVFYWLFDLATQYLPGPRAHLRVKLQPGTDKKKWGQTSGTKQH